MSACHGKNWPPELASPRKPSPPASETADIHLPVYFEVDERLELAGTPFIPGKKLPRPGVFFKDLYDKGILDRQEVNRQLRIMRQLRQPVAR